MERIGAKKSVRYLEKVDPRHVWASQSQVAGAERREREGVGEGASGRWKSFAFVRAATSRVGEERVASEALYTFLQLSLSLACPFLALRETFMATFNLR